MKTIKPTSTEWLCNLLSAFSITAISLLIAPKVSALEVGPGDFEYLPSGINVGMLYYQYAQRDSLYVQGKKAPGSSNFTTDIGIFRYIRPVELSPSVTVDLNLIQPFGHIDAKGDASFLGNASGTGDLTLGPVLKFLLDPVTRDVFSIAPFIILPTGSYDNDESLNLGDNRWSGVLQLAYVKHFSPDWVLDTIGDVSIYGRNNDFGMAGAELKQKPRYELQTHARYIVSPETSLAAGIGHYKGGETEINDVERNDKLKTTYGRLSITHFVDKTSQIQVMIGKDFKVENGFKEDARINLRVAKIF
ncbi:transporter [Pseudomonas fluorescens]|nr:transporter [Pseudomonas fluorescens]